uniref:IMPACT-like protein n=1 Tax=Magallana gigas TaxID=29159 RepID=K1R5K9_MAGGI|eukprot:XP_011422110.1 PREDICTED: protein IMPACT homolog [Crassostrea gigas]
MSDPVKISRNSIVLPNGSKYSEEVPLLSNAAVLKIDQTESEQLDDIVTMNTEPIQKNGSEFYATGTKVGSVNQAQNFYKKVCIDPYVASVDSRILIYRFMEQGKLIENYHDDGEHGAGRRLLKYMRENQIMDVAIVVTRWMGEHIGPQCFTIMEGLVNEVANLILE